MTKEQERFLREGKRRAKMREQNNRIMQQYFYKKLMRIFHHTGYASEDNLPEALLAQLQNPKAVYLFDGTTIYPVDN